MATGNKEQGESTLEKRKRFTRDGSVLGGFVQGVLVGVPFHFLLYFSLLMVALALEFVGLDLSFAGVGRDGAYIGLRLLFSVGWGQLFITVPMARRASLLGQEKRSAGLAIAAASMFLVTAMCGAST